MRVAEQSPTASRHENHRGKTSPSLSECLCTRECPRLQSAGITAPSSSHTVSHLKLQDRRQSNLFAQVRRRRTTRGSSGKRRDHRREGAWDSLYTSFVTLQQVRVLCVKREGYLGQTRSTTTWRCEPTENTEPRRRL